MREDRECSRSLTHLYTDGRNSRTLQETDFVVVAVVEFKDPQYCDDGRGREITVSYRCIVLDLLGIEKE